MYLYVFICLNISVVPRVIQLIRLIDLFFVHFPPWIATFVHQYDGLATFRVLLFVRFLPALSIFADRYSSLATFAIFQL